MATATLRTGDIKKFGVDNYNVLPGEKWGIISNVGIFLGTETREDARHYRQAGERIAKILKITPKTVTVEISK